MEAIKIRNLNKNKKRKAHANPKKEGYSKPFTDASGSKGGKGRKGENAHTAIKDSIQNLHACKKK
jgi:hypothetical protein